MQLTKHAAGTELQTVYKLNIIFQLRVVPARASMVLDNDTMSLP